MLFNRWTGLTKGIATNGARTLLVAPGLTTSKQEATRSEDAIRLEAIKPKTKASETLRSH